MKHYTILINYYSTVLDLKKRIYEVNDFHFAKELTLHYDGYKLQDDRTLVSYNITAGATIILNIPLNCVELSKNEHSQANQLHQSEYSSCNIY